MIIENAAPLYFVILSIHNALMHIFLQGVRFFIFISHQLYDDNGVYRVASLYVVLVVTTKMSANYKRFCVSEVSSHWLISPCA